MTTAPDPTTQPTRPDADQAPRAPRARQRDQRGEGIISAAIAVLIMAFLGVAMWFAFNSMFERTAHNIDNQVNCIGSSSSASC